MTPVPGTLINCDEGLRRIAQIRDPATRSLVNMVFTYLVQKVHLEKRECPVGDLDMLFLTKSLEEFFSEHDIIARALQGEQVGAWFEEAV